MKIIMIKNFWRSGTVELEQGKEYEAPADLSLKFAATLVEAGKAISAGKAVNKPKRKKVT